MKTHSAEFVAKLRSIDLTKVPVLSTDRHIPRKTLSAMVRKLLKQLGIKGVSVTTPTYSMAHSINIRLPPTEINRTESGARGLLEGILLAAFPSHDDRSDSQSDSFDYKFSID